MKMTFRIAMLLSILAWTSVAFAEDSQPAASPATPAPAAAPAATSNGETGGDSVPDSVAILTGGTAGGGRKSPFGGIVILEQSLGVGTFVDNQYARTPSYAWLLSLRPRYYFTNKLSAELRFDITQELTTSYGTSTTYKRQVMPSDLLLTVRYHPVYRIPVVGIGISPFVRLGAPTSYESRYRNLYLSTAAGLDLNRLLGPVYLNYTFRTTKNFNRTTVATVTGPVAVFRQAGAEDLGGGEVATGDNNVEWSIFNSLMATFILSDEWSVSLQLAIANSWIYKSYANDALTAEYAKPGRGQRDRTYGTIDVSYQPWEHFGFSLGVSSTQPAKTADNKSFRFPFFDFTSEGNNYTTFYFDVYATY
ncbi:MAG: hypothetical protein FJ087_19525 [Deltaproteobacteria bacterium]|nr:hypothetical protein [Deltaproteobacteria bacterium]